MTREIDHAAAKRLDLHLQRRIDAGEIPGCTTHVWVGGELAHSNALGWRDIEHSVPMTDDTICRLASMTKPIVSLALMQCYEAGLIQLNDPVHELIPAFKGVQVRVGDDGMGMAVTERSRRAMTVHDLLTHQSGLPAGPGRLGETPPTLAERAAELATQPLLFQPGSRFSYGVSTDMVGHLVELASGSPLDVYLAEHVLGPLGMDDTRFGVPADAQDRVATLYRPTPDGMQVMPFPPSVPPEQVTYFSGAGGLVGTAEDYQRFARMLVGQGELDGERIISRKTLELMTLNHLPGGRTLPEHTIDALFTEYHGIGFGLGVGVMVDPARAQVSGSPGEFFWTGAFGSLAFVDPREQLSVVFMTQALPDMGRLRNPYGWRELRALVYALLP